MTPRASVASMTLGIGECQCANRSSTSAWGSATQFHPEKSGDAGATLLENWTKTL